MSDAMASELFLGKFPFYDHVMNMKPNVPWFAGMFSLTQRIFYYFRLVFGYRLSTIINFLIICASYYKAKELLVFLLNDIDEKIKDKINKYFFTILLCTFAFISLLKEYIMIGQTHVKNDLFVIPLFLECLLLVLTKKNNDKTYAYAGLLFGLSIAIKLTNIVFFIPLIIYFIINEIRFKNIKLKNILIAFIFFIIPVLSYLVYNSLTTGNPVFPFYNKLFKSPYYPLIDFKDRRWGPQTVWETIFWPVVLLFKNERFAELGFNSHSLAIGYFVSFFTILLQRKIPALKKLVPVCICLICSVILWAASTGYARYAIALEVLSFIILAVFVFVLCCNNSGKSKYLAFAFSFVAFISLSISYGNLTMSFFEWSWRPSVFTNKADYWEKAKKNVKHISNDRKVTDDPIVKEKLNSVKTWICLGPRTGFPVLANPNADFFILYNNYPQNPELFTIDYFLSRSRDGIYTFELNEDYFETLAHYGFVVTGYEEMYLNSIYEEPLLFLKLGVSAFLLEENEVRQSGFYDDYWIKGDATIIVNDKIANHFLLTGFYPDNFPADNSFTVTINNNASATVDLIPGNAFNVELDFENDYGDIQIIRLITERTFIPINEGWNEDGRELAVFISSWELSDKYIDSIFGEIIEDLFQHGFHSDGWISGDATIIVKDRTANRLSLTGFYPDSFPAHNRFTVTVNNEESVTVDLIPGNGFNVQLDFENNRNTVHIGLKTENAIIPINEGWNEDGRELAVIVSSWELYNTNTDTNLDEITDELFQ
jgi:hypothetical protein